MTLLWLIVGLKYRTCLQFSFLPIIARTSGGNRLRYSFRPIFSSEMERNDEMTSPLLARKIYKGFGLNFSIQKVKRLRKILGWVMTSTKYCQ